MTSARVQELVQSLGLKPHPEGGFYRETWRSPLRVMPADGRGERAALTAIHFLLPAGAVSRWHRVRSDEVWTHVEGAPLELITIPASQWLLERVILGPLAAGHAPAHCVPADCWQAARSQGDYTLVSCAVGPGFEFTDFELMSDNLEVAERLRGEFPGAEQLL